MRCYMLHKKYSFLVIWQEHNMVWNSKFFITFEREMWEGQYFKRRGIIFASPNYNFVTYYTQHNNMEHIPCPFGNWDNEIRVNNLNKACYQHSQSHTAIFHWNFQKYSVKFIYAIIDWVWLGFPELCIVGYSLTGLIIRRVGHTCNMYRRS